MSQSYITFRITIYVWHSVKRWLSTYDNTLWEMRWVVRHSDDSSQDECFVDIMDDNLAMIFKLLWADNIICHQ